MKKIVIILILGSLFLNCETKKNKTVFKKTEFFYPRIPKINVSVTKEKIYLDSIENFGELNRLADQIVCQGNWPILIFETDIFKYNFALYKECSHLTDIVDYSDSNVIAIEKDQIIINDQILFPFDSLKTVLRNHILNPEREFKYSKNIEKAIIFYYQKKSYSSENIKKQLIRVAAEFNELNSENLDSLPLKIKLMDYPYIRIQPPLFPE